VHTYTTAGRLYSWLRDSLPTPDGELVLPPSWCHVGWECLPKKIPTQAAIAPATTPTVTSTSAPTATSQSVPAETLPAQQPVQP
jgi:hypothetical protein